MVSWKRLSTYYLCVSADDLKALTISPVESEKFVGLFPFEQRPQIWDLQVSVMKPNRKTKLSAHDADLICPMAREVPQWVEVYIVDCPGDQKEHQAPEEKHERLR